MIDLRPYFHHTEWRPMPHSAGVDVGSDWTDKAADDPVFGIYKRCGFWTTVEASILHSCASQVKGSWLEIGSHTGWTTAHIAEPGNQVAAIDPMYANDEFRARALENLTNCGVADRVALCVATSDLYFVIAHKERYAGVCIDGNHDSPHPLRDAQNAHAVLENRGVILFHDAKGQPVLDGVAWLIEQGYKARVYGLTHGVAVCWRGNDLTPPEI